MNAGCDGYYDDEMRDCGDRRVKWLLVIALVELIQLAEQIYE